MTPGELRALFHACDVFVLPSVTRAGTAKVRVRVLPDESLNRLDPALVSPALLPLVVEEAPTRAIVCAGAGHFARAYVTSLTGSSGQLCTNPGLLFVPEGEAGDGRDGQE